MSQWTLYRSLWNTAGSWPHTQVCSPYSECKCNKAPAVVTSSSDWSDRPNVFNCPDGINVDGLQTAWDDHDAIKRDQWCRKVECAQSISWYIVSKNNNASSVFGIIYEFTLWAYFCKILKPILRVRRPRHSSMLRSMKRCDNLFHSSTMACFSWSTVVNFRLC